MRAAVELLAENANDIIAEANELVADDVVSLLTKIQELHSSDDPTDHVKARFLCMRLGAEFTSLLITMLGNPQEAISEVISGALHLSEESDPNED